MAAPTFVAAATVAYNLATNTARATSSLTLVAGDLLVYLAAVESTGSTTDMPPLTPTATGVTWTAKSRYPAAAATDQNNVGIATATGVVGTGGTVTVSATRGGSGTTFWGFTVVQFRGSNGVGNVAISAAGQTSPSVGVTTLGANSSLCVITADWTAAISSTQATRQSAYALVNGAAPVEDAYYGPDGTHYGVEVFRYADAGAAGSKTAGQSITGKFVTAVVEVQGGAGGAAFAMPPPLVVGQAVQRAASW